MLKREISKRINVARNTRKPYDDMSSSHYHDGYEIYHLINGSVRYFLDSKIYDLEPGDIILIPPDKLHKTTVISSVPAERLLISFTADFFNKKIGDNLFNCFNNPFVSEPQKYIDILNKIEDEFLFKDEYTEDIVKNLISILLVKLSRVSTNNIYNSSNSSLSEEIVKYINNNYDKNISRQTLANEFYLSENHISTLFKKETGFGFNEYLNIIRIKNSEHLLITTNMSISKISFACGFQDSNYYSSVFKKVNGVSPLKYRKENSKKES